MSEAVTKYFSVKLGGSKRKQSSSSPPESPSGPNPETDVQKQERKKTRTKKTGESDCVENMEEIQATLDCMSQKLTCMCTTADFQKLKEEIVGIKETFAHRLDKMESMLFDMAREKDQLSEEVKRMKKENGDLRGQMEAHRAEDRRLRAAHNDLEQHGRLWNVRVHGVKEAANPKDEAARDCVRKCVEIFSQRLGVTVTPEDVEVAHRSGRQVQVEGQQTKAAEATLRGQLTCDPFTLPPSIQLHCRMYRDNVITGDLCSPLCDLGHICDATSTYGNAHKEVMVTRCHGGFCGQAQQAILKHDEVYATATDGYDKFYSAVNATVLEATDTWTESLKTLLHRHLPNSSSTDTFLLEMLQEWSAAFTGNVSAHALYASLTQLFRQKEYVLFQAYRNTGVFPKVYGTCGPLYLVEFCDPVLKQDRRYNKALVLKDLLDWNRASRTQVDEKKQQALSNTQNMLFFDNRDNTDKSFHKRGGIFFNDLPGLFMDKTHNTDQTSSLKRSQTDELILPSEVEMKNSGRDHVYVVNLNLDKNSHLPWSDRAQVAIKIFHFLEHLEREVTFPEHIHLCDPKLEHFAVGRDDGKLKLIDADLVLFDSNMATESMAPDVDTGACTEHEDCSDVMCRGWCWTQKGRCASRRVNNNLQGICENVFLRPSLEYGAVFTYTIPAAVYDDVIRALCECATNVTSLWERVIPLKLPSASTRERLVEVLERSLRLENSPTLRMQMGGGGEDFDFLLEYCKSFSQSP
ncbi:hypothetical protein ACOMHN_002143 [Nucella lapillus]